VGNSVLKLHSSMLNTGSHERALFIWCVTIMSHGQLQSRDCGAMMTPPGALPACVIWTADLATYKPESHDTCGAMEL
jgi:hypothetical protein